MTSHVILPSKSPPDIDQSNLSPRHFADQWKIWLVDDAQWIIMDNITSLVIFNFLHIHHDEVPCQCAYNLEQIGLHILSQIKAHWSMYYLDTQQKLCN